MIPFIICLLITMALLALFACFCATKAIKFARAVVAIGLALAFSQAFKLVPTSGFLNVVAWIITGFGLLYLLSFLPRADMAVLFFCTLFVSLIITLMTTMIISGMKENSFEISVGHEIFNKVLSVGIAVYAVIKNKEKMKPSSPVFVIRLVDRLMASVMYVAASAITMVSLYENWELPTAVIGTVLAVTFVGTFVADIFLAKKFLFN